MKNTGSFLAVTGLIAILLAETSTAQSWQLVQLPSGTVAQSSAFDPTDVDHVVALSSFGLEFYESFDAGGSWSTSPVPFGAAEFEYATAVEFEHDGHLFVLGGITYPSAGQSLAVRRLPGGTWETSGPAAPQGGFENYAARRMVSSPSGAIAMAVGGTDTTFYWSQAQVQVRASAGAPWQPTSASYSLGDVTRLQMGRLTNGTERLFYSVANSLFGPNYSLYAASVGGGQVHLMTTDQSSALPAAGRVMGNVVYAFPAVYDDPGSLRRSDDGGETWTQETGFGVIRELLRGNVDPSLVLRQDFGSAPFLSRDGGATWVSLPAPPVNGLSPTFLGIAHDDSRLYAAAGAGAGAYAWLNLRSPIGSVECTSAPNVTGVPARLAVQGSASVAARDLVLWATDLPPQQFGLFLGSLTPSNVPGAGGSFGTLCLGGSIGRIGYQGLFSGATGELAFPMDVTRVPTPTGTTAIQAGQTWRFQTWFRDSSQGMPGSNFSESVAVTFTP